MPEEHISVEELLGLGHLDSEFDLFEILQQRLSILRTVAEDVGAGELKELFDALDRVNFAREDLLLAFIREECRVDDLEHVPQVADLVRDGVRSGQNESLAGKVVQCLLPLAVFSVIHDYLQERHLLKHFRRVVLDHLSCRDKQLELEQPAPFSELSLNRDVLLVEDPLPKLSQSFLHVWVVIIVDERLQVGPPLRQTPPVLKLLPGSDNEERAFYLVLPLQLVEEDQECHGLAEPFLVSEDDIAVLDERLVKPVLAENLVVDELQILGPELSPRVLLVLLIRCVVHEALAQVVLVQAFNLRLIDLEHDEVVKDRLALLVGKHLDGPRVVSDHLHAVRLKQTFVQSLELDDVVATWHLGSPLA